MNDQFRDPMVASTTSFQTSGPGRADVPLEACDHHGGAVSRTHHVLVSLVRSYIRLVSSEWPSVCRRDPDFSVEAAHNYGLGLIRMLAEFQVANGMKDEMSVRLAVELSEAKRIAQRKIREPITASVEPKPSGSRWRRGYRKSGSPSGPAST